MESEMEVPKSPAEEVQENEATKLPISKILEFLISKVESGRLLPPALTSPPWRIPLASDHDLASKINSILSKSMETQSSKIPGSDEFDNFIISNSCLAVSGLMRYYLTCLGLAPQDVSVVFGILLWDAGARDGPDDFEGTPHVWLDILGHPIDNTHVALPEDSEEHLEYFYQAKQANYYRNVDPLKSNLKLYLGSKETTVTTRHNLKVFRTYITHDTSGGDLVEKYLVFALECANLNPSVKMFDILMRKFFKDDLNIPVGDLVYKWRSLCWSCSKKASEEKLKTCTQCNLAKYCDKECQKNDWKAHKLLHKELELTQQVLAEQAEETTEEQED
jgi:hypothetical protein